jgi:multicomponent Na+:H+ antiporter subunit E
MNRLVLFILLSLFWIMLTWTAELPGPAYAQDVGVGLAVAVLVTWTMSARPVERTIRWLEPMRYAWAFAYIFVLAAYIIKANLEVAYRVLHPAMPIRPGIVRVKTKLRGPAARTILGNSITLCPGTLTLDIWEDGTMMVHWIYVRTEDEEEAGQQIIGRFEWFIERIFE